jgi:cytochrome c oxidase cbb3-type subunit 3
MAGQRDVDQTTGTETTGHEWDGIKELNTPLPRWWLWTWFACIVWAVGYWILMPAWPLVNGYTPGLLGISQRAMVAESLTEAKQAQSGYVNRIVDASLADIEADPALLEFALAGGHSAFAVNCSQCHGLGAEGGPGYANLNDDDWLWGGTLDDIAQTIRFGIRSGHDEARVGDMPAFLRDGILDRAQVEDVVSYVLSLSGEAGDAAAVTRGAAVFAEQCTACHQDGGVGSHKLGAPNLTDGIWLYGGDRDTIIRTVSGGRAGVMPAWSGRLDAGVIKQLAVYVHGLGGGE